ncbi:MAG: hypothetical protein WD030_11345, partial [Pirellulales bacterium]
TLSFTGKPIPPGPPGNSLSADNDNTFQKVGSALFRAIGRQVAGESSLPANLEIRMKQAIPAAEQAVEDPFGPEQFDDD